MTKILLSRGTMIAAASAVAILLAVAGDATAQMKKSAKMAAPPPPAPGFCTASVNTFKWGHMGWRTQSGSVVPTLAMCYDTHCPAQC